MKHTIFVPRWHPAKVNELLRGHWSKGNRLKKRDRTLVWSYAKDAKIPHAEGKRRLCVEIILDKGQRGGDVDAYHKSLCDALKHARLIKDDNRQWLEIAPVAFGRDELWGTEITLEDLTP